MHTKNLCPQRQGLSTLQLHSPELSCCCWIRAELLLTWSPFWLYHSLCILRGAVVCERGGELSTPAVPRRAGWARTVGGEIWERNTLNLEDTLFSFPNMPHMSSERQTGLKRFRIRTLFQPIDVTECTVWCWDLVDLFTGHCDWHIATCPLASLHCLWEMSLQS